MNYIKLMRPKHYIKNILIFVPLIFSGKFLNTNNFLQTLYGFIVFSLIASTIYIINDIKDKDKDRKHPTKKNRPIASGKVSVRSAIIEIILIVVVSALLAYFLKLPKLSIAFLLAYFVLNLAYSLGLKNIPIIDVLILVSGFVLRVLFGASILRIEVSNWLYLAVLSLSFYLGLGKRRNEINKNGAQSRKVLEYYNKEFLDKNMYMFLCMSIIFYSLWATDSNVVTANHNLLIYTIPLVITVCMKYSMDIEGSESSGDPVEVILKDKLILVLGFLLVLSVFLILYL